MSIFLASTFLMLMLLGPSGNKPGVIFEQNLISSREISLENRQNDRFVNNVFKDNILLNIAYLRGQVSKMPIDWQEVNKPFTYEFTLMPDKTFAFHDDLLPEYNGKVVKTTRAHFNAREGFKTDGYLYGDGVCHLASLFYWAAREANLEAVAPTNHDFAVIPDIPKKLGVSIYSNPISKGSNARQNLYITNNRPQPVTFRIQYSNNNLKISIYEVTQPLILPG